MKPALLLAAAAGLALAAGAAVRASHDERPGLLPYDHPEAVARGAVLYAENCASCHGADLSGQAGADWRVRDADGYLPAPPHDETGHTWHHPDEVLIAITTLGTEALIGGDYRSRMMGFGEVLSGPLTEHVQSEAYGRLAGRVLEATETSYSRPGGYSQPVVVARAVSKAVAATRPRTRYVVGALAWPLMTLRKLVSDRMFDRILMSQIR